MAFTPIPKPLSTPTQKRKKKFFLFEENGTPLYKVSAKQ
jgi:hypothetical protein